MKTFTKIRPFIAVAAVVTASLAAGASAVAALAASGSTASKGVEKINVKVDGFFGITVSRAVEVVFSQKKFPGYVEVSGSPEIVDNVVVECDGGTLNITMAGGHDYNHMDAKVTVCAPTLNYVNVSQASSFYGKGKYASSTPLDLSSKSAASINFDEVSVPQLTIVASSASSVNLLSVEASDIDAKASSASDIKLKGINARKVTAKASSAADINLSGRCNFKGLSSSSGSEIKARGLVEDDMPFKGKTGSAPQQP